MITEQCNFRCKYCIYSEMYKYSRTHSENKMRWEVAKKAIDYFFEFNLKSIKHNPTLVPYVGFYGGEALTNYDLIVQSVEYIEERYRPKFTNIIYTITTNGSLLNEINIQFMLKHNFFISISVDGNKENHDRNRRSVFNQPTFDRVMKNIDMLDKMRIKEEKQRGELYPYNLLMTYDNDTNMKEISNQANEDPDFYSRFVRLSKVRDIDTAYYEHQRTEKYIRKEINDLMRDFVHNKRNDNISKILYRQNVASVALNKQFTANILYGTCVPGSRLAVSSSGKFYICERIDYQSPIGDIDHGIDFKKQTRILETYVNERNLYCKNCNISNLCNQCFAVCLGDEGEFLVNSKMCEKFKKNIQKLFSLYYTARENGIDEI